MSRYFIIFCHIYLFRIYQYKQAKSSYLFSGNASDTKFDETVGHIEDIIMGK